MRETVLLPYFVKTDFQQQQKINPIIKIHYQSYEDRKLGKKL